MSLGNLFEQYVKHGLYLRAWSPKTVAVYRRAFASLQKSRREDERDLTKAHLEDWVASLKEQGRTATCVNIYIRSVNAFLNWAHCEEHLPKRLKLKQLPNPQVPLKPISDQEVALILAFRPTWRNSLRTWTLIKLLLDTGIRIDEALRASVANASLDNLQLRVLGKGNRERIVPMSMEGRKARFRYLQWRQRKALDSPYLFCTRNGTRITYRNAHRDMKRVCDRVGVTGSHVHAHAFRHKFAVTYIRRGGDIYRLSRILGHTSVNTTQIYLRSMGAEEVGENHSSLSALSSSAGRRSGDGGSSRT